MSNLNTIKYLVRSLGTLSLKGRVGHLKIFRFLYPNHLYTANPDIVIEGFARSANTYFIRALEMKEVPLVISHHLHYPFQIQRAIDRNIPLVILIRKPLDACLSSSIFKRIGFVTLELVKWKLFYEKVHQNIGYEKLKLFSFDDIASEDINKILEELLEDLNVKSSKEVTSLAVKNKIKRLYKEEKRPKYQLTIPSDQKERQKEYLKCNINKLDEYFIKKNQEIYTQLIQFKRSVNIGLNPTGPSKNS